MRPSLRRAPMARIARMAQGHALARLAGLVGSAVLASLLAALAGCSPKPPIRIGMLAEVHGADVNFGEDARNGVLLAIEQRNADGGVAGRPLELVVQPVDTAQAQQARDALVDLHGAGVQVLVGPFGTRMAMELLPAAASTGMLMLSPTVSSNALVGLDDQLLRLNQSNRNSAQAAARMLRASGRQRVAVARDLRNADYAVPWSDAFRAAFEAAGGGVVAVIDFGMDPELAFEAVVQRLLAAQPDGLVFVASGADAARLAQQVRKRDTGLPLAAAGWAATPALLELGGKAVEGMQVLQSHDPQSSSPHFRAFQQAFRQRYDTAPGYGATAAYDAVLVLAEALARAQAGESPKQALLRHGPYQGLQQRIVFDGFGDAERSGHPTVVRDGRFESLP